MTRGGGRGARGDDRTHRSPRDRLIALVQRRIARASSPRWQLSVILALTGLFGFLTSLLLLWRGLDHMGWRYLIAFSTAYAVFLLSLRVWARTQRESYDSSDLVDALDVDVDLPAGSPSSPIPEPFEGSGGSFGGGGAGGSWHEAGADPSGHVDVPSVGGHAVDVAGPGLPLDIDEGWVFVLPAAVALSGLVAVGFVVYSAPVLLAELVLDVVILGGVYRRLRGIEPQSWRWGAIRRTWVPALALCILVVGLGFVLESIAPGARTLGEALAAG